MVSVVGVAWFGLALALAWLGLWQIGTIGNLENAFLLAFWGTPLRAFVVLHLFKTLQVWEGGLAIEHCFFCCRTARIVKEYAKKNLHN